MSDAILLRMRGKDTLQTTALLKHLISGLNHTADIRYKCLCL